MKSDAGSERLELDQIVTTEEDVRALRHAREGRAMTTEQWLRALRALPPPSPDELRRRKGPSGREPFRL